LEQPSNREEARPRDQGAGVNSPPIPGQWLSTPDKREISEREGGFLRGDLISKWLANWGDNVFIFHSLLNILIDCL
jgi:hypothetical protein